MRLRTNMTPGVVGTALAAVAAGSLVLFSLVLQQSAFDSSFTQGLDPLSPIGTDSSISVAAPPGEDDTADDGTNVAENTSPEDGGASAPTSGTDSLGPILGDGDDDGSLVASTEDPPGDGDVPGASGGTGNSVNSGGSGPTVNADGPQATINKDPNGRPDDVTLPDRNGPKNTAPPHGRDDDDPRDDDSDDRDDDSDDRDKDKSKKNDRQKSWDKDKSSDRDKPKGEDKSKNDRQKSWDKDKSSDRDKPKGEDKNPGKGQDDDRSTNPGRGNDGSDEADDDRSREGDEPNESEPEDRNDRHDTRRDPDDDDDAPDDDVDDDDDREDSHHSDDGSQGHSRARGPKG